MKKSIFKEDKKYTFSDYFEMKNPTDEIVGEFGYSFAFEVISLPKSNNFAPSIVDNLKETYYKILPKIVINSEIAKREFLIAPILLEIAKNTDLKINVEYPLDLDDKLSGSLDYLLRSKQDLIVIEAKKKDLDGGFNQLAVELIALDKYEDNDDLHILYGAITTGDIWKFGILDRDKKHIVKNIHSHTIPEDTEEVLATIMGIINKI
jgi:hypothetical protein